MDGAVYPRTEEVFDIPCNLTFPDWQSSWTQSVTAGFPVPHTGLPRCSVPWGGYMTVAERFSTDWTGAGFRFREVRRMAAG
jgi:hypothetical protein